MIRVVAVRAGETITSLAERMASPNLRKEHFITLNGLAEKQTLAPGRLVKLVVACN